MTHATVPWHPGFNEHLPGWLVAVLAEACKIGLRHPGVLMNAELLRLHLFEVWIKVDGAMSPIVLSVAEARGVMALLRDFGFVEPVGNAPGGSA